MKRYTPLFLIVALFLSFGALAQSRPGALRGKVTDAKTGETVPFANITVKDQSGNTIAGATTDIDGRYNINPIEPGSYDVTATFVGYASNKVTGVIISPNVPTLLNFKLSTSSEVLEVVELRFEAPLIDKTKSSKVTTMESISMMQSRDISSIAPSPQGVTREADEAATQIRPSRAEGQVYFVDGVKVRGSVAIPQAAIAQTEAVTVGLPAQYSSPDQVSSSSPQEEPLQIYYELSPKERYATENYKSIPENEFLGTFRSPLSTFGADVDVASYANVRRMLKEGYLPHPDAVRLEEFINYFNYDYPEPPQGEPFSVSLDLATCDWNKQHKLLRIGLKTETISQEELPPSNLVFLIDVSGSMSSSDKLPLLQKAMKLMVKNLKPEDRVAFVVYASATGLVLESTPASDQRKIRNAINGLSAGGSTAGGAGIKLAYGVAQKHFNEDYNNRVILATDGDFNVGVSSERGLIELIEEKRESGIFLSVLGFGTGNYQDAKMEALADHGNGNYAYIDGLLEARKVLADELGANLHVVAKDTKFQIEFNPQKVVAYRLLGYENRILEDQDFDDDTKDAGDIGAGHTVTAVYELVMRGNEGDILLSKEQKLRYQTEVLKDDAYGDELAYLKLRYKDPDAKRSKLKVVSVKDIESSNPDFAFLTAVLQYGLILRESEFAGESSLESAIALAEANAGEDPQGYRREFIQLCKLAKDLQD